MIPTQASEAPDRTQPGTRPLRDAQGLRGRDLAACNRLQKDGQNLLESLGCAQ